MSTSDPSPNSKRPTKDDISQDTRSKFSSLPIFTSTLNDPSFHPISMSRTVTHSGRGHTLMGNTWNTPETIDVLLSFYRGRDTHHSPSSDSSSSSSSPDSSLSTGPATEIRRFYAFGPHLNAHPDLLHGGVISCILDSGLGGAVGISQGRQPQTLGSGKGMDADLPMFTAQLNVRYRKPVRTPGVVVVRAWVERVEGGGRKVWARGVVEGKDGVHAEAEGLWVRGRAARV